MSEAALEPPLAESGNPDFLTIRIGWRNLWRNPRRTWLTAGGCAFAVFLVVSFMALQLGQYDTMMENSTSLMSGHLQIQSQMYLDDERFEDTIAHASEVLQLVRSVPGVTGVMPRIEAFALASADERSFASLVLGLDMAAEAQHLRFVRMLSAGRAVNGPGEALLGTILARNLGIGPGAEVVVLGAGKEGGVAAMVVNVAGLLETGINDLDRSLLLADRAEVADAFGLLDELHSIVVKTDDLSRSADTVKRLASRLPEGLRVRNWEEVMPEVEQGIEVDKIGGRFMYGIILMLVVFSVVNTFIMTVFERTREFGMLLAVGMRPGKIILMVQCEALFVSLVGIAIGLGLAVGLTFYLMDVGIYLGEDMQEYTTQFYMPDRLFPAFSAEALLTAPIIMLIGTQLAALIPAQRIRRLKPVEALRDD